MQQMQIQEYMSWWLYQAEKLFLFQEVLWTSEIDGTH